MKINSTVNPLKTHRGRIAGYSAHFASISTASDHATKQEAQDDLLLLIAQRCDYRSTDVQVLAIRGHVGIFSYGLFGDVETRHLWPGESRVSHSSGSKSMEEAKASFRYHVAQHTWNGLDETSSVSDLTEAQQREFTSWVHFQKAYVYAHESLGMSDVDSHRWACDCRNYVSVPAIQPIAA